MTVIVGFFSCWGCRWRKTGIIWFMP